MTIRIGSMIPAACTGEIVSAITGTANIPSPPRPPLDIPVVMTAITAHIQNKGSGIKESDITLTGVKLLAFQTSKNGYASLMITLDLNADIGEAEDADGIASELSILKYVSSANIACGGHRGDAQSMRRTVTAALRHKVQIGAHPAYPDRQNFGRKSMQLETDISPSALRQTLTSQITNLIDIAASEDAEVAYVKPHGALYNDAVQSTAHANLIAAVIADFKLGFMGAPNSEMGRAAERHNLRFISEGFIDRRYTDDGHLQSRAIKGAVIASIDTPKRPLGRCHKRL